MATWTPADRHNFGLALRDLVFPHWSTRLGIPPRHTLTGVYFVAVGMAFVTLLSLVNRASGSLARSAEPLGDRIRALIDAGPHLPSRSEVYSADGRLLALLHGDQNRDEVSFKQISPLVIRATVALEDSRFYHHDGVDAMALGRAALKNFSAGEVKQGAGTITMQLARNAYLEDREKTASRKLAEIVAARELEDRYEKDEILEQYLNTVYFGSGAYGIKAAAETYFRKPPNRLQLGEAALLVGIMRSPVRLNPRTNPDGARARRALVLDAMHGMGMIDEATAERTKKEPLKLAPKRESNGVLLLEPDAGPFVEFVKRELLRDERLGSTSEERVSTLFEGGLRIDTTLNFAQQRTAVASLRAQLPSPKDPAASLVSVEPRTGFIRAMANINALESFNVAVQGRRQPGSTFKTFVLVAGLERGLSPFETYDGSSPKTLKLGNGKTWKTSNYTGSIGGRMTLLTATENSVNTVFAQIGMQVGAAKVVDVAHRMGITSHLDAYPSIALGALQYGVSPLEMASAYATLANRGVAVPPVAVTRVTTPSGKTILAHRQGGRRALAPGVADAATAMLERVVTNGTGRRALGAGRPVAAKTGTTDDYKDAWFVGYAAQASTAVWMGYPTRSQPLYNIHGYAQLYGGSLPAAAWTSFMRSALKGQTRVGFVDVNLRSVGRIGVLKPAEVVAPPRPKAEPKATTTPEPEPKQSDSKAKGKPKPVPPEPEPSTEPEPPPEPSPTPTG